MGTLTRSRSAFSQSGHRSITLEGCGKGDLVFVVWSMRHGQFMVVQDSLTLYFVHADSLSALQLTAPAPTPAPSLPAISHPSAALQEVGNEAPLFNQIPVPYYAIGRVIDKEYCQARKVSLWDKQIDYILIYHLSLLYRMRTAIASARAPSSTASNWLRYHRAMLRVANVWNVSE